MLKYLVSIFFILISFAESADAQRTAVTLSGQNIIQQPDGTWKKYLPVTSDSSGLITDNKNTNELPFATGTNENVISDYRLLLNTAQNFELESFAAVDFLELSIAQNEITLSKARLAKDKYATNEIISIIKQQIKDKKKASNRYQEIFDKILEIRNIPSLNASNQEKSFKKLFTYFRIPLDSKSNESKVYDIVANSKEKTHIPECLVVRDEVKLKKRVIEIESKPLFSFTPVRLKSYFKEKDLMQTNASFIKIGKDYFLKMHIKLFSKDAAKSYGFVAKESMMNIEFINGKKEILYALDGAPAQFENYTGYTNYTILYPVSNDLLKVMEDVPLHTISLMWSSGYETYDIYEVETFISLVNCIKSIH